MRDVIQIVIVLLNLRKDTGSGPLDYHIIQFSDLTLHVKGVVLGIL
jgi:hypothetical protein